MTAILSHKRHTFLLPLLALLLFLDPPARVRPAVRRPVWWLLIAGRGGRAHLSGRA